MEERYTIRVTDQAQEQLREIAHYIAYELQAPETALRMLETLETAMNTLSLFPSRIALTEEEPWRSRGVRRMPVKNYLVYFWVDEEAKKVQVFGIIYGRRDQRHQLSNLDMN